MLAVSLILAVVVCGAWSAPQYLGDLDARELTDYYLATGQCINATHHVNCATCTSPIFACNLVNAVAASPGSVAFLQICPCTAEPCTFVAVSRLPC